MAAIYGSVAFVTSVCLVLRRACGVGGNDVQTVPTGDQMMVGAISSSVNGRTRARLGQGLGRRPCLPKRCLRKTGEES